MLVIPAIRCATYRAVVKLDFDDLVIPVTSVIGLPFFGGQPFLTHRRTP